MAEYGTVEGVSDDQTQQLPATTPPPGAAAAAAGSRQDTRLDNYVDRYADRTHSMRASAVRALFAVANRPEVVSLAGGMPNISDLPLNVVAQSLSDLIMTNGPQAMQYGSGQGEPMIREAITEVMALEGITAHPDDVVVTCGSQQALDLVTRIFCNPGDVVIVEAPSYVGALTTFRSYEVDVVHVAMDDDGIQPDALEQAVASVRARGKEPKFLYTIPNYNNPSGITQPWRRREEIVELARRLDLLVVEDNPYGLLSLDAEPIPAIRSIEDERVLYLGSFSKTFAPGFRVGWVLAPHAVREKITLAQEAATLCPPVFSQFAIAAYLRDHDWQQQIISFKDMYRARRDAMLAALSEYMPEGTSWTEPAGGFFVWVTLPAGLDSQAMLPRAVTARVAYTPGTAFYADGFGAGHLRLSFCYPPPAEIREGVRRLAEVMRRELDLQRTFGIHNPTPHGIDPGPAPDVN